MAKLIRCPAGHIYDSAAHEACPECARTGMPKAAEDARPAQVSKAARGDEDDSSKAEGTGKRGVTLTRLIGGGAAAALLIAAAIFLLRPSGAPVQQADSTNQTPVSAPGPSTQTSAADPKTDPDYGACEKASGDSSIAACDRAIASGKFAGADLGALYRYRGFAKSHAEKPDLDAALADYSEAVKLEPNSFVPFILRANIYADKREQELAIKDYDRAIELSPRSDFYSNRGNALRKTGKVDLAIADLDQAIKLDANYFGAYWNRGLAYQDKGDKEKAADDYKKALSLNPSESARKEIEALLKEVAPEPAGQQATPPQQGDAATADTGKGKEPEPTPSSKVLKSSDEVLADPDFKACRSMGTNQAADCDRAIASGKFEGDALAVLHNNRGQARSLNNNDDGSLEDFNKSIELNPNNAAPYSNRGVIYSGRKEYERAIADFDKAIELNATLPYPFKGRGLAYWQKRDLKHAVEDYKKALSLNPPPKAKEEWEQDLEEIEAEADYKDTIDEAEAARDAEPTQKHSDAANDTGKGNTPEPPPSSKVLKSTDEVLADPDFKACTVGTPQIADCDRAISSGKFEGEGLAALYNARGQTRYFKHDLDGAVDDYTKALAADGTFASSYSNRGLVYLDRKDYDRAIADFDHAIEIDGDKDYHPFDNRGLAYWSKGDTEQAAADYKKALSLHPSDKAKQAIEKSLKDIEGGAKYPPGSEPTQKQGSAMNAELPTSGAWAAIATDGTGRWGSAVGQPSQDAARNAALKDCGGSGCKILDARQARCIAYAESREGGYWYFGYLGLDESAVQSDALNACNKAAPAGSCKLVKSTCGQGSADTPTDDKNSALSGLREGGSGNASALPSTTTPKEGQGSSLSQLPKEDKGSAGNGSGRPSGARLPEGGVSPLPALPGGVATTVRPGVYRLNGINGGGDTYAGMAALTEDGDKFRLTVWNGAKTLRATGQFADGVLKMKYTDGVRVTFVLKSDGSLDGKWDKGDGSERFEPVAFTATTEMPLVEGVYSVAGRQPDGKPTSGTIKITKRGTGFHLEWSYNDGDKFDGWGTFARNILSLSSANNAGWDKDAVIAYALGTDGVLAGLYANGTGQEKLTPEGWKPSPSADATPQDSKPGPGSASQASADPDKDGEYCMKTLAPDAMPACDRAIASGTFGMLDLGALHGRRALLHAANGNDAAAIADFSEAIRLDGSRDIYFGNRASVYDHRNEYDKAIADLDEAIRLNRIDFSYYQLRGSAYHKKGDVNHARADYNLALALNPDAKHKKDIEQALKDLGPDYRNMKVQ